MMTWIFWLALALLLVRLGIELWLSSLNRAEVRRFQQAPPPSVAAIMDEVTYAKSVQYTLDRSRFGDITEIFGTLVLILVLLSGILPLLFAHIAAWGAPGATWDDAVFILVVMVLISIPSLPFEWWSTFRLEGKYGFNKATPALWIADKVKGLALVLAIGFPLLWLLLSLVQWVGRWWWLCAFAIVFGFQLVMLVLYPKIILPLFNKLTPLAEGELRTRLLALGERTGFRATTIEVIDGSKRSGHSNAYFTGFGRFRRIVLFDTLIAQMTTTELEAVLAHEIGHYRCGHIPRLIAVSAFSLFLGLAAIAYLAQSPWFNLSFGFPPFEMAPAFLLFGLLSGVATFWFTPLMNRVSRRFEYEADAFARDAMGDAAPLRDALRKLVQKNLSNLTPHPWFSAFYYSHPTLVERERALLLP